MKLSRSTPQTPLYRNFSHVLRRARKSCWRAAKQPIAKLVPYRPLGKGRRFGALRGTVAIGPEVYEPSPDDELARWH